MNERKTLKTTYRRLENFLYLMGVQPMRTTKAWDGSTVWEYEDTTELRIIAEAFKKLEEELKALREGEANER